MRYKITVERIEPHPKAGEKIERQYSGGLNYGGYPQEECYPPTISSSILFAELSESEYKACKLAIIEAKE